MRGSAVMRGSIVVSGLGKRFRVSKGRRHRTLKAALVTGAREQDGLFWGLRDVTFRVPPGRAVGVIGRNGAGKSTLLRLIGGVGRPDEGTIEVNGRVGALLEISAGLTDDLSGRENVFLLGIIAGMTRHEVAGRFDQIVSFSELGEFIDRPVRTYSTGMKMRLAFAVAVHIEPDILLVDEVLAVGDIAFQSKCFARIREIQRAGCTIFFVSHELDRVLEWCEEVLFLKDGRVAAYGPTKEIIGLFTASMEGVVTSDALAPVTAAGTELQPNVNRFGSRDLEIDAVCLAGDDGANRWTFTAGEAMTISLRYRSKLPISEFLLLFAIYAADGTMCLEVNTQSANIPMSAGSAPRSIAIKLGRIDLAAGQYFVTVGAFTPDWETVLDYHAEAYPFTVQSTRVSKGYILPPLTWVEEEEDA